MKQLKTEAVQVKILKNVKKTIGNTDTHTNVEYGMLSMVILYHEERKPMNNPAHETDFIGHFESGTDHCPGGVRALCWKKSR